MNCLQGFWHHYHRGRFNAARGFVGGAAAVFTNPFISPESFNAARGFVGGAASIMCHPDFKYPMFQCRTRLCGWCSSAETPEHSAGHDVSMPHAALWVVQPSSGLMSWRMALCFNAARGFVGGAACFLGMNGRFSSWFQCRTRLCGWCSEDFQSV